MTVEYHPTHLPDPLQSQRVWSFLEPAMITNAHTINFIQRFAVAFGDVRGAACGVQRSWFATSPRWLTGGPTSHVARRARHGYPTSDHGGGT